MKPMRAGAITFLLLEQGISTFFVSFTPFSNEKSIIYPHLLSDTLTRKVQNRFLFCLLEHILKKCFWLWKTQANGDLGQSPSRRKKFGLFETKLCILMIIFD